jgi:membrane carboxypeptidase/penicillin-binding protein
MLLLLLALCVPAFSGALAADEKLIDIPIGQDTTVYDENGQPIAQFNRHKRVALHIKRMRETASPA